MKVRQKAFIVAGIILTILAIIATGFCIILSNFYSDQIDIVDKPIETEKIQVELPLNQIEEKDDTTATKDNIYKEEQKEDEIINIILCGMDARKYETNSRSDAIILASYNKTQHTVKLVSFMRDTWVYLPERGWGRINSATAYGGTGLLINTINENFDLDVQNYIQIKFDDFKRVIDILGGIDIELTKREISYINNKLHNEDRDWKNDIKAEPGIVHLNGTQALWHCRNRSVGDSDFDRTRRQRETISAIINKAITMDIVQATQLVYEMSEYVNTNVPITTLIDLGTDAIISKNLTIEMNRIPYDKNFTYANKGGASVIEIDIEETTKLLHKFLGYEIEEENNTNKEDGNNKDKEGLNLETRQ